jgi:hypothetical protein
VCIIHLVEKIAAGMNCNCEAREGIVSLYACLAGKLEWSYFQLGSHCGLDAFYGLIHINFTNVCLQFVVLVNSYTVQTVRRSTSCSAASDLHHL